MVRASRLFLNSLLEAGEPSCKCKSGDYNKGFSSLDAALHDIGVQPTGHKT